MKFARVPTPKTAAPDRSSSPRAAPGAPIPLRLATILAPYREDHGDLLFRIERLPRGARLTVGRNNGDRTWTLNEREIEKAAYIAPEGAEELPEFGVRVIAMPSGQTIAVLDTRVPAPKHGHSSTAAESHPKHKSETAPVEKVPAREHATVSAAAHGANEPGSAPAPVKAQEGAQAHLAETLALLQRERAAAVSDAEKIWKAEEDARLASARMQWQEETAKAIAEARAQAGRGAPQQDVETALRDAERQWKSAEAARYSTAALQWQEKLDAAVAEARGEAERRWQSKFDSAVAEARAQSATDQRAETDEVQRLISEIAAARGTVAKREIELAAAQADIQRLGSEIAAARSVLGQRETELTAVQVENQQLRSDSQRALESALQQAEAKWKAAETARLAEAEAQWREQIGKAVADALATAEKLRDERFQRESERLNGELSAARASLAERNGELTGLRSAFTQAQADWQRDKESALAGAESAWRAAEAGRLAVAKAEWQAQSDKALADARAETEAIRKEYNSSDIHLLRAKVSEAEAELAQARAAFLEERARLQRETAEALVEAEKQWKIDEISRMTQAREQWQAQTAKAVAEARSNAGSTREAASDLELRRLRADYTAIKATLEARELELQRAKAAAENNGDDEIILRPDRIRPLPSAEQDNKRKNSGGKALGLAVALLAGAAGIALLYYPDLGAVLQPVVQQQVSAADSAPAPAAAPAPQPAQKTATVIRGANVRTAPSGDAIVMLSLPRGTQVVPLERQGSWTRIQVKAEGNSSEPREGWVFTSFLKESDAQ